MYYFRFVVLYSDDLCISCVPRYVLFSGARWECSIISIIIKNFPFLVVCCCLSLWYTLAIDSNCTLLFASVDPFSSCIHISHQLTKKSRWEIIDLFCWLSLRRENGFILLALFRNSIPRYVGLLYLIWQACCLLHKLSFSYICGVDRVKNCLLDFAFVQYGNLVLSISIRYSVCICRHL